MPLIHNFSSTTLWKAFILNAVAMALVTGLTASLTVSIDDIFKKKKKPLNTGERIGISMAIALVSALLIYGILYLVFGFGKGMLANAPKSPNK